MSWFLRDRRGPEWKQGWTDQTLSSISLPPPPLLAVFAIVILFLSLTHYTNYKAQMHYTMINFHVLLFMLPVALIFIVRSMSADRKFALRIPRLEHGSILGAGKFPWGVAALVVLLLVMISYKSTFNSQWFRPLWRYD